MRTHSILRSLLGVALLGALCVFPAFAQSSPSPEELELFGEIVDVRVVNLEIVVEKGGERVHGLGPDDFVLEVDGEETPIEFFTEVRGGTAVAGGASADATVPALAPGEIVGTSYLVFIDDVFSLAPERNRVLRRLQDDLVRLGPDDRMAIVAYGGESVELLSTWTGSTRELERALRKAEDRPSKGLLQRSREDLNDTFYYRNRFSRFNRYDYGFTGPGARSFADVIDVVDAAASTLRAFAQPEGRKVMMLLGGNWPPALTGPTGFDDTIDYAGYRRGSRDLFSPLVDTANRLGYTVYPVDVPGVESRFADASVGTAREAAFVRRTSRNREWLREGSFVRLADETGGVALLDGAATSALERVEEDTRSYYWIGFTPEWQANDERHRVDIDVPGLRGARVRLRESFTDLSAQTEATLRLESAQLFDLPVPSAGALTVQVGEPTDGGWSKVVLPLAIEIPLDRVTHLPTTDGWATRLELRVAVTDDRGDRADIPVVPLVYESVEEPAEGATETYVARLKMRERPHRVLVSLLDTATGEELSTRLEVNPEI